jgi:hypothetical protein
VTVRRQLEEQVRAQFMAKGGHPRLERPHYMTLGACPWLMQWYERGLKLRVPVAEFDASNISFTYGEIFRAMRLQDGKLH